MKADTYQRFGRVLINNAGISQRRFLFLFGESFKLPWSIISAWAVTERLIRNRKTGEMRKDSQILELQCRGKIHFIARSARDANFELIVAELRRRLPEKETESVLAKVTAGRG